MHNTAHNNLEVHTIVHNTAYNNLVVHTIVHNTAQNNLEVHTIVHNTAYNNLEVYTIVHNTAHTNLVVHTIVHNTAHTNLVVHNIDAQHFDFNRIHSLKYLRSVTFGCKYTRIRKSEFVTTTHVISYSCIKTKKFGKFPFFIEGLNFFNGHFGDIF